MSQNYEQYPETYIKTLSYIRAFAEESGSDRLPSEEHLAQQLGVSRIKIRDVLSQLQAAGYVTRKRGVGTLLNRYVLRERARLDIDSIYVQMIEDCGHEARADLNSFRLLRHPGKDISEQLELKKGEDVYEFRKTAYADGKPVIYTVDYIPSEFYENSDSDLSLMDRNIFYFLQGMCDDMLETLMVHMDVTCADEVLAKAMEVPKGSPLLLLKSVCYTQSSMPILYSVEYLNTKLLPFSFQKRILSGKFNPTKPPEL